LPVVFKLYEICSVDSQKNHLKCHQICQILRLKYTKFDFGWGSAPDPAGGAYSAHTDPLAGFEGPTNSKGGRGKGGRRGDGRGAGRRERRRQGRGGLSGNMAEAFCLKSAPAY